MQQRITLGTMQFEWEITPQFFLIHSLLLQVQPLGQPNACLWVDIMEEGVGVQAVAQLIEYALRGGWLRLPQVPLQLRLRQKGGKIWAVAQTLHEERDVALLVAKTAAQKTTPLDLAPTKTALLTLEQQLKLALPTLFQQLYMYAGDGGWGPDQGVFSLAQIAAFAISLQDKSSTDRAWRLDAGFCAFMDWGWGVYSLLDCNTPSGAVWGMEVSPEGLRTWLHCHRLGDWLHIWLGHHIDGREVWLDMNRKRGYV